MHFREKVDFILEDFDDGTYSRLVAVNKIELAAEREIREQKSRLLKYIIGCFIVGCLIGIILALISV